MKSWLFWCTNLGALLIGILQGCSPSERGDGNGAAGNSGTGGVGGMGNAGAAGALATSCLGKGSPNGAAPRSSSGAWALRQSVVNPLGLGHRNVYLAEGILAVENLYYLDSLFAAYENNGGIWQLRSGQGSVRSTEPAQFTHVAFSGRALATVHSMASDPFPGAVLGLTLYDQNWSAIWHTPEQPTALALGDGVLAWLPTSGGLTVVQETPAGWLERQVIAGGERKPQAVAMLGKTVVAGFEDKVQLFQEQGDVWAPISELQVAASKLAAEGDTLVLAVPGAEVLRVLRWVGTDSQVEAEIPLAKDESARLCNTIGLQLRDDYLIYTTGLVPGTAGRVRLFERKQSAWSKLDEFDVTVPHSGNPDHVAAVEGDALAIATETDAQIYERVIR